MPVKRVLDVVVSAAALALLAPLFALIAVAIKLDDGGPVFYSHPRVGKGFREFGLRKFRTMVANADRLGGPVTAAGDPRVTRVGRFLRKYKIDELPQLLNVLKGDMTLVGPRPECERYVAMFRARYEKVLSHRPGITDPATLAYRNEESLLVGGDVERIYVDRILPRKLDLSIDYLERRTLRSDLIIILRTLARIVWPLPRERN